MYNLEELVQERTRLAARIAYARKTGRTGPDLEALLQKRAHLTELIGQARERERELQILFGEAGYLALQLFPPETTLADLLEWMATQPQYAEAAAWFERRTAR